VSAETAPHYFSLDHRALEEYNTPAEMNPPLREPRGCGGNQKGAFLTHPGGKERGVPLTLRLIREGTLSWPDVVRKVSYAPASQLGIPGGALKEGAVADLAVLDPEHSYVLKAEDMRSKSKNSPFIGWSMQGITVLTMVGGRIVWERNL